MTFFRALRDPETCEGFEFYAEQETFIRRALTLTPEGRLPYVELLFSVGKKHGKTTLGAMALLYVIVVLAGPRGEGYVVANDLEQAQGRVFQSAVAIVEATSFLHSCAKVTSDTITFRQNNSTIKALASDYAGAAGANPNITVFDELWGYTSERSQRLWDEMVPPPTRRVACRLTVSYAGFSGESVLLENLTKRALLGEQIAPDLYAQPGLLGFVCHRTCAPWITEAWLNEMRTTLRPNAYLRFIENRFVTSESTFIDMAWWDECVDNQHRPILNDRSLQVYVGVDASVKRDSTALAAVTFDRKANKVSLIAHRIFQPSPDEPLDFENTLEAAVLDLHRRFKVREVRYDPYQLASSAQRLKKQGVKMEEFPQSTPNISEATTRLYELIKQRNLRVYPNDEIRLAISRAVAVEGSRGWKISKEKQPHKIDIVVALGMACVAATEAPKSTYDASAVWVRGDNARTSAVDLICSLAARNGIIV